MTTSEGQRMLYGYVGSMWTLPGHRDEVVAILTDGAAALRDAGCHLYVVGVSADDAEEIVVTEVWDSAEAHEASLQLPHVRDQISQAMPMLAGRFESRELDVVGGLGVPTA